MDNPIAFTHPFFECASFTKQGINLHAVLDIDSLPEDVHAALLQSCKTLHEYRRVIVLGHVGPALWESVSPLIARGKDVAPIDAFTLSAVHAFFSEHTAAIAYKVLYPPSSFLPLQRFGALLGWHHDTPFKVGANRHWGSWFAYRALLLVDAELDVSTALPGQSPCLDCQLKPCIHACPAKAMADARFDLQACIHYRKQPDSACGQRCLARLACPVGSAHQYSDEQLRYHYSHSLKMIKSRRHL